MRTRDSPDGSHQSQLFSSNPAPGRSTAVADSIPARCGRRIEHADPRCAAMTLADHRDRNQHSETQDRLTGRSTLNLTAAGSIPAIFRQRKV